MDELKAVGAFTNLGAFAIIAYLILWITRNLPGWLDKWNATRVEVEKVKLENTRLVMEGQEQARQQYGTMLQYEREICKEQFHRLEQTINAATAATQAVASQVEALRREMNDGRDGTHKEVMGTLQEQMERIRTIDHTTRDLAQSRAMADAVSRQKRPQRPQGDES